MIKNNYIHTTTPSVSIINKPYLEPIYDHAQTCLISLIHAMNSNSFGDNTIRKGCREIQHYRNTYLGDDKTFILDSGGYSIIAGQIPSIQVNRFIEGYITALELLKDDYDYVFSLDIPSFLAWKKGDGPNPNTMTNIRSLNHRSLSYSIDLMKQFPEIRDKFNMVLQWKMPAQYQIWDSLYTELDMKSYVNSYSVGGLVGLLAMCPKMDFSPFIAGCYYWLYRYIERNDFTKPLFIHLLGQYHRSARFIMFFLQNLFSDYLKIVNQTCIITYDTINYSITSMFKTRVGVDVHELDGSKLNTIHSYELDDSIFSKIYTTADSLDKFHNNWKKIKSNQPLNDTSFLIPTYVYSQIQLDSFFNQFIKNQQLVDVFRSGDTIAEDSLSGWERLNPKLKGAISANRNPEIFTNIFKKGVSSSFNRIFKFHQWFIYRNRDKSKLDELIYEFIKDVNFPFDLP